MIHPISFTILFGFYNLAALQAIRNLLLGNAIDSQKGNDCGGIVNIGNPVVWDWIDFCCVVVLNGGSAVFDFCHLKICFCVAEATVRASCLSDVIIVPERKLQPCSAVRTVDNIADQNPIACTAACDFVRKEPGKKAVILILEDFYDRRRTSENIAWIYETDFEFLKQDDVVQIIVGGKRATDYLVRLLIAGIDRSRIVCCASETETVQHLQWDKFDKLMILYDLYNTESLSQIKKQLQEDAAI